MAPPDDVGAAVVVNTSCVPYTWIDSCIECPVAVPTSVAVPLPVQVAALLHRIAVGVEGSGTPAATW
jgi:hypothetical protein